jgi:hypothetical protein
MRTVLWSRTHGVAARIRKTGRFRRDVYRQNRKMPIGPLMDGGPGPSRTGTSLSEQRILSPVRLPIPPRGLVRRAESRLGCGVKARVVDQGSNDEVGAAMLSAIS